MWTAEFFVCSSISKGKVQPCTATEALYSYWGSVQLLRLCTATEALYIYWGSVQLLRLCTATEDVYSHWGSVQLLRLCTATEAVYSHWGSVQLLRLCTGRTTHREIRGVPLLFLYHGTRRGWGVRFTPRPLFTPGNDPVPIVQGAGWAPGPVWTGAENLTPTGIRSPDRPARSQSLYRLSYPALFFNVLAHNLERKLVFFFYRGGSYFYEIKFRRVCEE